MIPLRPLTLSAAFAVLALAGCSSHTEAMPPAPVTFSQTAPERIVVPAPAATLKPAEPEPVPTPEEVAAFAAPVLK